jgi:zinc transport system ATP-binding protein
MQIEQHNPADQQHCITVDNVSFGYKRGDPVLEDISFSINRGDYLGIIGPNGGGKTTLLKLMLGLLEPTQGKVSVFGQDVYRLKGERAHIGYVPQRSSQIDINFPATVSEIVASGRTARVGLFSRFGAADRAAIERALDITGMVKYRDTLINSLSGGERQRAFIARALAGEPQVLFLDEPTAGVDVASQEQFYGFLAELNHKHGLTIVLVSHDIDVVNNEVHTLLCVNRKVICFGPAKDLLNERYFEQLYGKQAKFTFHGH